MKTALIILLLMPLSIMAQIDYNYNQVNAISSQYPQKRLVWIKQSQIKQSVSFDHLIFFVKKSNDNELTGNDIILKIYHNNKLIHTKEFTAMEQGPNSIELFSPIQLNKNDSITLNLTLKPNPDSLDVSYLFSIIDRTQYLRKHPQEYIAMTHSNLKSNTYTKPSDKPIYKQTGMFGETYYQNKPRKKHKKGNGLANTLEFLIGM